MTPCRLLLFSSLVSVAALAQSAKDRDGLEVQKSRALTLAQVAHDKHYDAGLFDLSDLPAYAP